MKKYPVGPETRKQASKTKAGALARAMHELLYCGDVVPANEKLPHTEGGHGITVVKFPAARYVTMEELRLDQSIKVPECVRIDEHTVSTSKLLREVRDYLDFESLREVIP